MKIGFVVSFFDFRNDVRRVIAEVAQQHQVVIFGRSEQREEILRHLPQGLEFRLINEKKNNFWNNLWLRLYILLRRIPKSRYNFFLMEFFKASLTSDPVLRKKNHQIVAWVRRLPKIISYDFYLKRLDYQAATNLAGIDQFICFTAIADDFLMARLLAENHPVKVYVYSWDHACKHACFSKKTQYVCWNEPIRKDIIELQHIASTQVKVVGVSQFAYIDEFRKLRPALPRTYPFEYVYFGCAIGVASLIEEEIKVVVSVAKILAQVRPDLKLVVRPYPVQSDWGVYDSLRFLPNVVLDDGFKTADLSVKKDHILEKFEKITSAQAFFHLGTTMGLEACFTNTTSFILDYGYISKEGLSLHGFIHQYQNERHLMALAPQNVVKSEEQLVQIFKNLSHLIYYELNQKVQSQYQIKSFQAFAEDLITI
ncbi:MAG: hypothetical protein R2822_01860 [Spirosomataceae bacterium]